jgi:inorganic pyrophosphatase
VEWPAHTPERYEWIEGTGELVHVSTDKYPPPEHYGCVPGAISPGDNELLDVLLLDDGPRRPSERLQARLIGVLRRSDGDHKLITVDAARSGLTDLSQIAPERLATIWAWFHRRHVLLGWSGAENARTVLDDARRVWQLRTA